MARQESKKEEDQTATREHQSLQEFLKQMKFKKAMFGGVQEADVWKQIGELNSRYEEALAAERVRYDTLLKERAQVMARRLHRGKAEGSSKQAKAGDSRNE